MGVILWLSFPSRIQVDQKEHPMSTLEQDVRTLQDQLRVQQSQVRRQRRWNIALGGVLLLSGCIATTNSQSVPDVIQAKKFEVVNEQGVAVVTLHSYQGHGTIVSHDKKGVRTFLVINEVGEDGVSRGSVQTQNGKGGTLVLLGTSATGGNVVVGNAIGNSVAVIASGPDGSGVVATFDSAGKERTSTTPSP
jgi:hypothetical protein